MTKFILALITAIIALYVLIAHLHALSTPPHAVGGGDWLIFSGAAILFGGAIAIIGLHFSEISDPTASYESETRRPVLLGFLTSLALIMLYSVYFAHLSRTTPPDSGLETPLLAATSSRASETRESGETLSGVEHLGADQETKINAQAPSEMQGKSDSPISGGVSGETRSAKEVTHKKTPPKRAPQTAKTPSPNSREVTMVSYDFPVPAPGERLFVRFE